MSEKISKQKKAKAKPKKTGEKLQKPVEEKKNLEMKIEPSQKIVSGTATCQAAEQPPRKTVGTGTFVIICAVLAIVILSIALIPKQIREKEFEGDKYNNFEFVETDDGYWMTVLQKGPQSYYVPFYYHPRDLEDIPVEAYLRAKFFEIQANGGSIIITLDPDSTDNKIVIAGVEIARITGGRYDLLNVPTSSAFIKQPTSQSAETGTPIVTCKDANNQTMVIWITLSELNIAYSQGYCVIVEAKTYEDMIRVADRLMYHLLGIMN